ncbi:MAG: hypothetical protein IPK39_14075 [Sulfuritalea sp.]|nr:hypothetical protein [Sulfuritalea sp.]
MAALTSTQLNLMQTSDVAALTTTQVSTLTSTQLNGLDSTHLGRCPPRRWRASPARS